MSEIIDIYKSDIESEQSLPLFLSNIKAGFPSPADDHIDKKLDLNQRHIKHTSSTFFVVVKGDSMQGAGILSGDVLVVDRSIKPENKKIIIAVLNGGFTVKRFKEIGDKKYLVSENPDFSPIEITEGMDFEVWGVVTGVSRVI